MSTTDHPTPDQIAEDEATITHLRAAGIGAVMAMALLPSAGCQGRKYQDNLNNQPLTPVATVTR